MVLNEITAEKNELPRRRLRSLSRSFSEKNNISNVKSSNEDNSAGVKENKKKEIVINEITSAKSELPRRRLRSLSRSFSEKRFFSTDQSSNEENSTNTKEEEKKQEMISGNNEIKLEKSKLPQRRSRSTLRSFIKKGNISTNNSNEDSSTYGTEEEKKEEMLINETTPEKSKLPQRRSKSLSRIFSEKTNISIDKYSNEENFADNEEKEKKEETTGESKISAAVKPEKTKRGRKQKKSESPVYSSTLEQKSTKTETIEFEPAKYVKKLKKKKRVTMKRTKWANGILKTDSKRKKINRSKLSLPQSIEINQLSMSENLIENIEEFEPELPELLQSQILDDDEHSLFKIELKPDIYYFLDDGYSFDCKLCDYKGKSIVCHYRTKHPKSENLISRLNPKEAEKAQIESKLNKFDEIKPFEEIENDKKRKTTFVCRFCNMLMISEISIFVDHVCCHTGEYRYLCELCSFIAGYKPTLCNHFNKTHPELKAPFKLTPIWPSPPNFRIMFGYLCKACNFTQILKKNIQKHINVSHSGQNIEIIKISMSSKSVTMDDIITTKNVETKMSEIEKNKEKIPEQLIEKEKLKEKKEIFSNIYSKQSAFELINQLDSKFQSILCKDEPIDIENHQMEDMHNEEIKNVKEELFPPKDFNLKNCSTISFTETEYSNEENEDTSPKKDLPNDEYEITKSNKEMDISNAELAINLAKNIYCHSDIAQFDQIIEIKGQEKIEDTVKNINVGAIEVQIRNKEQNYICKVSNCNFTNLHKINFIQHCNDVHSNITVLCEICAKENPSNYFTMISLVCHLFDVHTTNITNAKIVNYIPAQISKVESLQEMSESNIKSIEPSEPDLGFLQIKDIRTLTEEEEQNLQFYLQNTSPKLQNSQLNVEIIQPNLVNMEKKMTDVPAKNELSKCVSSTYKKQRTSNNVIWHKTIKIFNQMLVYPKILDIYKCPINICSFSSGSQKEFKIHMTSHKCQITVCVYCRKRIKSENLIRHIDTIHSHCTLQCALCFYRTITKKYLVYHQKNIHKQSSNKLAEGLFYHLNPKNTTKFIFDIPPRNTIIFPYKCIQDNCTQQFLIADDFMVHLHIYHKKNFTCAICDDPTMYYVTAQYLIQHYVMHNIARYQCRYCICGTPGIDTMLKHYAKNHQQLEPICYVRQKNENVSTKTLDDIILINMDSKQVVKPKLNAEQSTTKQNISISSPTITSTIPVDHNYSTPFIEESPTTTVARDAKKLENSKIINIDQEKDLENSETINIDLDNYTINSETIEVADLNEANRNCNELDVTLKHKGIKSKNAVENVVYQSTDNFEKSNELTKKVTDFIENELYKCGTPNCTYSTNFLNDYRMHLFVCNVTSNTYFCGHCDTKFTSVTDLCKHIEIHGKNKFTCGVCEYKSSLEQVVKHMKDLHKIITTKLNTVSLKKDTDKDHFIVEAVHEREKISILKSMIFERATFKEKNKVENTLGPEIINHGLNLTLNPVSGSKKNEKMSHETITLVTSSHHEQIEGKMIEETNKESKDDKIYPEFVPVSKRFICGALNCFYLAHSDQMLRHHLTALHTDETVYKCPHCQIDIPFKILGLEIDKILCHLKMHDSYLYKCRNCELFHYEKRKIERHICENYPDTDKNIVIRELDNSNNLNDDKPTLPVSLLEQIATNDEIKNHTDKQTAYFKINEEQNITASMSSEIIPLHVNNKNEETSDSYSEISSEDMSNSLSNFQCKYCDFVAYTPKTLRKHERSHYMNFTYNCNCCNYALQVKSQNKTKISTIEISESELPIKRKRSLNEDNLEENPARTLEKNKGIVTTSTTPETIDDNNVQIYYACFLCWKRSNELDEIRSHFFKSHNWKHADLFKYKKVIMDKSKTQHYKCNFCEWFADAKTLKEHCLTIHDKTWVALRKTNLKCTICSQIFPNLKFIKQHFNEEHSTANIIFHTLLGNGMVLNKTEFLEEKQVLFVCIYCRTPFYNRIALFNHHSLFHSHLQFIENPDEEKQEMKKFKCSNCGHSSNSYTAMRMHLVRHFNIKPFVCSHCNEYFIRAFSLKNHHMRKHRDLPLINNKVPEFNEHMNKISATILYLNEDRTYSTKKKIPCAHCNLSFSNTRNLKHHQIRKHRDLLVPKLTKQIYENGIYFPKNKLKRPHNNSKLDESPTKILVLDGKLDINPIKRNVVMNSTTNQSEIVEFSFYRTKPCNITDYKNVVSEIDIMGKITRINVVALSHILNLSPKVQLVDIKYKVSY